MKKYIAEILGTFVLTLVVGLAISGNFVVPVPVLAGLVIMIFVYTVGHVSGGHFNPAITIGAWSIKKISNVDAAFYVVSQFVGAAVALIAITMSVGMPHLSPGMNVMTAIAECVGTLFFAFGVASVIYGKSPSELSGVVAGGSLILGITIAALLGSYGILNPALAFGVGTFNLVYVFAPIVGSVLGMQAYKYLAE